jgi:L-galactose dehydrogenase
MKTRILGKTGLNISELGLGSAFMAGQGQDGADRCVDYAVDHGVNYFDTAANYGDGRDETMLGAALKGKRDKVILATKVGFINRERYRLDGHRSADQLMEQFESSLKRLQTDYVDIIQVHEADYLKWWTDDILDAEDAGVWSALIEDDTDYDFSDAPVVKFLANAKHSGKARFIGLTAKNARVLARILKAVDVDSVMTAHQFNPVFRNAVEFLFPTAQDLRVGVVIGAPLMKGWLAVPQNAWQDNPPDWMDETFKTAYFKFLDIYADAGIPMAELCIRWMLSEQRQQSIVVGFSNLQEVEFNMSAALRGALPDDLNAAIEEIGIVHPLIYQGRTRI